MKKIICLAVALAAFATLWPSPSRADEKAEITLLPTRIVMGKTDRFATVTVKNSGQAEGNYTTDLIDMQMREDGMVVPLPEGQADEFSAKPYLHMAPRSFTLKPGESQNVRILLRKPENLAPGEYRSHLQVRLANDNVTAAAKPVKNSTAIAVKTNIVLVIPVIFRNGDTTLSMKIEDAKLTHDARGAPVLDMYLARTGDRSSMGDIAVNYIPPGGGSPKLLKSFPGVPVYRPTARRLIAVPLDVPPGTNLGEGTLDITYTAQAKEGGQQLAEARLALGH